MINGFELCDNSQRQDPSKSSGGSCIKLSSIIPTFRTTGWGVYLAPSKLDHSCLPNASVSFRFELWKSCKGSTISILFSFFRGKAIVVRSLVEIPAQKFDIERMFISYIDLMESSQNRQGLPNETKSKWNHSLDIELWTTEMIKDLATLKIEEEFCVRDTFSPANVCDALDRK